MKKRIASIYLLLIAAAVFSQNSKELNEYYHSQDSTVRNTRGIITGRGLNYFMATKVSYFLASEGDLSLKKNYATVNTEGNFSFGHNFTNKLEEKSDRVTWLFTPGIKTDYEDDFASFISEGKKSDVHATFKITRFFSGSLNFDGEKRIKQPKGAKPKKITVKVLEKDSMEFERCYLIAELLNDYKDEVKDFEERLSTISDSPVKVYKKKTFYSDLLDEYKNKLHEKESETIEEKKQYGGCNARWTSLVLDLPLWSSEYQIADSILPTDSIHHGFLKREYYNLETFLSFNFLHERRRAGKFFFNLSPGFKVTNNIATKELKESDYNTYRALGGKDTLTAVQYDSEKRYIGVFKKYYSPLIKGQIVWYLPGKAENIGIRISCEQYIGPDYHPTNLVFGIPLKFDGKEDDEWVNIELQARFNDTGWVVDKTASLKDRMAIGVTVGLPFSSILY